MNSIDSTLLDRALRFAVQAHAGTERRGKGFPYIVHPLEAVSIVATITSDQELLAAAALHDVVEDANCTIDALRAEFGDRVADIVDGLSDNGSQGLPVDAPWRDRKQAAIDRLAAAPYDTKIVAMGDKLSNMRAIAADYRHLGDQLWERFHAPGGKADHAWHYRGLAGSLFDLASTDAYREFCHHIDSTFGNDDYDLADAHRIDLNDYEQSGDGYSAVSYNHKGGRTMIKLSNSFIPVEVPINELRFARSVFRLGISTPLPGRLVTDGERFGSEFERITPKKSYARAISQEPEALAEYARRFAFQCRKLHQTTCHRSLFPSASEIAMRNIDNCPYYNEDEKERMRRFVRQVPESPTCVHGDLHIGNIITNGQRDYWIDLGDFSWGNPLFDFGMPYFVSKCIPEELAMHLYHITGQQMREVWRIFLCEYFGISTDEEIAAKEREIAPFAGIRAVYLATIDRMQPFLDSLIRQSLLD